SRGVSRGGPREEPRARWTGVARGPGRFPLPSRKFAAPVAKRPPALQVRDVLCASLRRTRTARSLGRSLFRRFLRLACLLRASRPRGAGWLAAGPFLACSFVLGAFGLLLTHGVYLAAGGAPRPVRQRFFARGFLFRLELVVDELQDRGLGRVPPTRSQPKDARVAAPPVDEARRDVLEDLLHGRAVGDPLRDLAPRAHPVVLGRRDQSLRQGPKLLRLRQRRLNAFVREERGELVRKHRQTMRRAPPELAAGPVVHHDELLVSGRDRLELHAE